MLEAARSTYGAADPNNSASVRGGGNGRNRGKPGYPVPDVLKVEAADSAGIAQALKANDQRLKKKGVNVTALKPLGKPGEHGIAYDMGGEKVLKVTDDSGEAEVSTGLIGKKLGHVCQIFDAFKLVGSELYGIVQEKLSPISDAEIAEFNDALVVTGITVWLKQNRGDWEKTKDQTIKFVRSEAKKERPRRVHKELEPQAYMEMANEAYKLLNNKYKLKDVHNELKSAGVEYYDYQGANLMKRGADFVAADLGGAGAKGGKQPPMLEALFREFGTHQPTGNTNKKSPSWRPEQIGGKLGDVEKAITKHAKTLEKRGIAINPNQKLGSGSFGIAYEISYKGRRMVVKMTTDEKEAKASNHVKGKPTKHVVRIVDVFQLKGTDVYGIVQEKLEQPSEEDKSEFDDFMEYVELIKGGNEIVNGDPEGLSEKIRKVFAKKPHLIDDFEEKMDHFQFGEIIKELHSLDVEFLDFHRENIMKRGSTFVIIDLGMSDSPGKAPDVIERVLRGLVKEAKADSIALVVDPLQPPSKGLLAPIRKLAQQFTKVVVVIDGKGGSADQPFDYETRREMLRKSCPDIEAKLEVYQGTSADLPGTIDKIIKDHNSSIEGDVAFNILVPPNVLGAAKQQVQAAHERKKLGQILFDPALAKVAPLQGYKDDGPALLKALQTADQKTFKMLVDPHLASNPTDLKAQYVKLRDELKKVEPVDEHLAEDGIDEKLTDVGGVAGIHRALEHNTKAIQNQKGINVSNMTGTGLGTGEDGVAYDMGGGKVFKVTTSEKEAGVSYHLMQRGKGLSHVIPIYDVFKFHQTPGQFSPVWGIEQKKLKPLDGIVKGSGGKIAYTPGSEAAAFEEIAGLLTNKENGMVNVTATKSYEEIVAKMKEILAGRSKTAEPGTAPGFAVTAPRKPRAGQQRTLPAFGADAAGFIEQMERFNLDRIIPQLRSLGIKFADFHAGNLLKDGTKYVIADMGGGEHPGADEPPELKPEAMVKEIVDSLVEDMAGYTGGAMHGMGGQSCSPKGGSSAWSSSMDMMTDQDVDDENPEDHIWQKQLTKLQPIGGHKTDVYHK